MECLKAATLQLPINSQLGFAYIIPYSGRPQFQIGYKGYIQLAMRTGQYRYLNADCLYEGMAIKRNYLTGETEITGEPSGEKIIGYFCHMETTNGFTKTIYMTEKEMAAWAKKYSKSYNRPGSAWETNHKEMGLKTVVRRLLSKWGIMSIEIQRALEADIEAEVASEIENNANGAIIDIKPTKGQKEAPKHVMETGEFDVDPAGF